MIIHIICCAAVFLSVESILKTYVSMHEHRVTKHRAGKMNEVRHSDELTIYINGPPVPKCKSIVKQAMAKYWSDKTIAKNKQGSGATATEWHFTRTTDNVKNYEVSKVVDRIKAQESSLPFL